MACIALVTVLILAALVAGIAIGLTFAEIKCLRERIKALEVSQAKHLPYKTANEIEDGISALLPLLFEEETTHERIQNALVHFQRARNGNAK
jgi:hypothetical protein